MLAFCYPAKVRAVIGLQRCGTKFMHIRRKFREQQIFAELISQLSTVK